MKTPLLLLGLALACALWAPAAEASTIFRAPISLGLAQGLVGYWSFEGKTVASTRVFDASGTCNYGTMTNGPKLVYGKIGQGMQFDGGNDYVTINDTDVLDLTTGMTLSAWVKFDKLEDSVQDLVRKNSAYLMQKMAAAASKLGVTSIRTVFFAGGTFANGQTAEFPVSLLNTSDWFHIVVSFDGTNHLIYLNGVLKDSYVRAGSLNANTNPV
jgi:hypothetical protein